MPVPGFGPDEAVIEKLLDLERRLRALENVEPPHVVGAAGQPAYQGTWSAYSTYVVAFYRRGERVWLSGIIEGGVSGTVAFTLPKGYRPAQTIFFDTDATAAKGRVDVNTNGTVVPSGASVAYVFLDGLSFRVA